MCLLSNRHDFITMLTPFESTYRKVIFEKVVVCLNKSNVLHLKKETAFRNGTQKEEMYGGNFAVL